MWKSYHIYTKNYPIFLEELNELRQRLENSEMFFVKYLDPIGVHIRLRLKVKGLESKEIDSIVYNHFKKYRVLKKIYDPEYNIFKENLHVYESYSTYLTEYLVNRGPSEVYSHYIIELVERILEKFGCNKEDFIKSYMAYWSGYKKFYSDADNRGLKEQLNKRDLPVTVNKFLSILEIFTEDSRKEELAFKYLHMTLNKMNFSIIEELVILEDYLNKKLHLNERSILI
ncbi:lantibiotic dehydratase C-terminal domain-containing protein [Solibacillus silvestris]